MLTPPQSRPTRHFLTSFVYIFPGERAAVPFWELARLVSKGVKRPLYLLSYNTNLNHLDQHTLSIGILSPHSFFTYHLQVCLEDITLNGLRYCVEPDMLCRELLISLRIVA